MAYWINDNEKIGNAKQIQYFCDSDSDIANLPTTKNKGIQQGLNTISNLPCGVGSVALSIASGNIYMLGSNDQWTKIP